MKKSSFRYNSFSQSSRSNLTIQGFKGVDYSTQKFLVAEERAIDILNYIYKDGIVQKRNGIETIFQVNGTQYIAEDDELENIKINETNFNGLWKFKAEDDKEHYIAHIGKLLYEIKNIENHNQIAIEPICNNYKDVYPVCYEFLNYRSSAFVGSHKLWFLGGNNYMCLRFFKDENNENTIQLFPVENSEFASIPTTTIAITYEDSLASGHRASLDKTNMLSMWRKNKLLSGTGKLDTVLTSEYYEYVLDSPLITKNESDFDKIFLSIETKGINIKNLSQDQLTEKRQIEFFDSVSTTLCKIVKCTENDKNELGEAYDLVKDKYLIVHVRLREEPLAIAMSIPTLPTNPNLLPDPNNNLHFNFDRFIPDKFVRSIVGYLDDINNPSLNARVILFDDYKPAIEGTSNITILYPCYNKENIEKINHCKFGIMFGSNNSQNRLFISGNENMPNCDWHSGHISEDNETSCNYGYFEDTSYCYYGETDNSIIGYDIISNNKLLVLKTKSDKETTIYFRTAELIEAIDSSGNLLKDINGNSLMQEGFSMIKGNSSVSCISPKAITNFNGDSVFISDEKNLVGLDLVGIVGDNQRYANSRSYYIDNELRNCDLKDAWLWTNNKYLLLILKDKIFITHYETKVNNQYEWWVMNIENVQSILEINNKIYLATSNGNLEYVTEQYEDVSKIFIGKGASLGFSLDDSTEFQVSYDILNKLDLSKKYYLKIIPLEEDIYSYVYQEIASIGLDNADFKIIKELNCLEIYCNNDYEKINNFINIFGDLEIVYLNSIVQNENLFSSKNRYELKRFVSDEVLLRNDCFKLYNYDTKEEINLGTLISATICYQLNKEYEMVDINKENATFRIKNNGEIVKFAIFDTQSEYVQFKAQIILRQPVEAYFITKPFTLGSLSYFKTIWSWTLTNDTSIPSELEVAIASNKIPFENMRTLAKISKDKLSFDFNNLNYNKIDFDKNIVPRTYTNHRILSQLKFVCFGFRNFNNTNSILSSMAIVYTTPFPSYGGD